MFMVIGKTLIKDSTRPGFVLVGIENMKYQCGSIRLGDVLKKNTEKSPEELLVAVRGDIDAFVGNEPQFDDITMLCVEYKRR